MSALTSIANSATLLSIRTALNNMFTELYGPGVPKNRFHPDGNETSIRAAAATALLIGGGIIYLPAAKIAISQPLPQGIISITSASCPL